MKAFITGITGFAGSHLAEHLLDCGDRVAGCSATGQWREGLPEGPLRGVPLVAWDLSAEVPDELLQTLRRSSPDVVYHLAAVAVPGDCGAAEPNRWAWEVNVAGTRRLMDCLQRLPAPPRMVLVSSCHVYAPVSIENPVLDENAPLGPVTGYGKTKMAAEQLLQNRQTPEPLDPVIVRPFKHAGPRQNARLMLPQWAVQMTRPGDEPVQVLNLDSFFDMTDVRDVVRAYRLLAERGRSGEIYNVGSGISRRSGDVYQRLRELAGCRQATVELSPGIRQEPIADIGRLHELTGWEPEIPLDVTLMDALEYWRSR